MKAVDFARGVACWMNMYRGDRIAIEIVEQICPDPALVIETKDVYRAYDRSIGYYLVTERDAPQLSEADAASVRSFARRFFEASLWICEETKQSSELFFRGCFRAFLAELPRQSQQRLEAEEVRLLLKHHHELEDILRIELAQTEQMLRGARQAVGAASVELGGPIFQKQKGPAKPS